MLKIWTEDDKTAEALSPKLRQIAFVNSAAAFLGLPGYAAYTCELGTAKRMHRAGRSLTVPRKLPSAPCVVWQIR